MSYKSNEAHQPPMYRKMRRKGPKTRKGPLPAGYLDKEGQAIRRPKKKVNLIKPGPGGYYPL